MFDLYIGFSFGKPVQEIVFNFNIFISGEFNIEFK